MGGECGGGPRVRGGVARSELIYDWNQAGAPGPLSLKPFAICDESLRDGLQSPSVVDPPIGQKIEWLHLMAELGVTWVNLGLPGAGQRQLDDCLALAREIARSRLPVRAACAGRTVESDVARISEVQQGSGLQVAAYTFIGTSPIRRYAEDWDLSRLLETSARAIRLAVREGLENAYVTEDTTRSHPKALGRLFRGALEAGSSALVLCDTVGHATPEGAARLVRWTRDLTLRLGANVRLEWHGHDDRGLALANALAALRAGVDVVHATALGTGERVGNVSMEHLLMNLKLAGAWNRPLRRLADYADLASRATGVPIPASYPMLGEDAFRTATGVHAAAILKAEELGDRQVADRVYSAVPAAEIGRRQRIEVGPMSGLSNVRHFFAQRGLPADDETCRRVLEAAKRADRVMTEAEILTLADGRPLLRKVP